MLPLRTMTTMERKNILNKLKPVLDKYHDKIVFAYLFGSSAEDLAGPLSDIDIAIYVNNPLALAFNDKLQFHADCCRALKRDDVDVVVLNQLKNIILQHEIVEKGVVMYDLDPETRIEYELKTLHNALDFRQQRERVMSA